MSETLININKIISIFTLIFILLINSACVTKKSNNNSIQIASNFLRTTQEANGSWDPNKFEGNFSHTDGSIAVTALAATALIRNYEAQNHQTISKAIHYIINNQNKDGSIGERNYANGVALYFLSSAYRHGFFKDESKLEALIKSVLIKKNSQGGWDYTEANADRNDMSISVWMCLAFYELSFSKKYAEIANEVLNNLNSFINRDTKGAGDNSITTKAVAAYTYGENPDSPSGKVMRSPGSTGQALILFIKSTKKELIHSNWVMTAIKDQEKALNSPTSDKSALPFCLYRMFFLINAHKNGIKLNDEIFIWIHNQICNYQLGDGSWLPSSPSVQFGGKIMATSLALLILSDQ